ncbi:helicase C-terminal domain-containing protein [Blastocladiella britannica]|nr:helicase C-terminal domain-containing protein [Blastocladiella britannica]
MPEYLLEGIRVRFPYEAYECQRVFMAKVIASLKSSTHALLESPTGTGKTLALLCAALAWREHQLQVGLPAIKLENKDADPAAAADDSAKFKIYYASRTHSQLTQVVKELKRAGYAAKTSVVGSREHLCVHPEVRAAPTRGAQSLLCRQKTKARTCSHYVKYEQSNMKLPNEILDIEEIAQYAKTRAGCPYYVARNSLAAAEIVFLPYNYIVDSTARRQQKINLDGAVVIFDEAHNLESACTDASSVVLSELELRQAIEEMKIALTLTPPIDPSGGKKSGGGGNSGLGGLTSGSSESKPVTLSDIKQLFESISSLTEEVVQLPLVSAAGKPPSRTEDGAFLYQLLARHAITWNTVARDIAILDTSSEMIVANSAAVKRSKGALTRLRAILETIFRPEFQHSMLQSMQYYKVHIVQEPVFASTAGPGANLGRPRVQRNVHFWCLHSGVAMRAIQRAGARSVLLASGTLSPMDGFAQEMGLHFPQQLENTHVVDSDQVLVGVVGAGPDGVKLSSVYKMRDNKEYQRALGGTVAQACGVAPEGCLGFFPSYAAMDTLTAAWSQQGVLDLLQRRKTVYKEPRDKSDLVAEVDAFAAAAYAATAQGQEAALESGAARSSTQGAALFGVCRGKISEGIDFADYRGRLALILGIPYPSLADPRIELKRAYLDQAKRSGHGTLTGSDWYTQQAARAVNQAVGRVIRHRYDYGAILLLDDRFGGGSIRNQLSKWLRPYVRTFTSVDQMTGALQVFFDRNEANTRARGLPPPLPPASIGSAVDDSTMGAAAAAAPGGNRGAYRGSSSALAASSLNGPMMIVPIRRQHSGMAASRQLPGSSFPAFRPAPASLPLPPPPALPRRTADALAARYGGSARQASEDSPPDIELDDGAPTSKRRRLDLIGICDTTSAPSPLPLTRFGTQPAGTISINVQPDASKATSSAPLDFKQLARAKMDPGELALFMKMLVDVKRKELTHEQMVEKAWETFERTKCADLFVQFMAFVPKHLKTSWQKRCQAHCTYFHFLFLMFMLTYMLITSSSES